MKRGLGRRSDVNWVAIDGDVVLTVPSRGEIHVISGATAALWQLLDGEPLDGLAEIVAEEFGLALEVVAPDLEAAVAQLDSLGVIEHP